MLTSPPWLLVCSVTDVISVWRTEQTEESADQPVNLLLSSASRRGGVSVVESDGRVELHAGDHLSVTLARLEDEQAAAEVRELLFRMADALAQHGAACWSFFLPFVDVVQTNKSAVCEINAD